MDSKIEEIKKERGGSNSFFSVPLDGERSKFNEGDRLIKGYAIVWGSKNDYNEIVIKGACTNSINARGVNGSGKNKIVILKQHRQSEPIGNITKLLEDDYGLYFEAEIITGTTASEEALSEVRQGVLRQLSYGFNYVWDKVEWDEVNDALILREIKLFEISLVTFSSDENAQLRSFNDYQKKEILKVFKHQEIENLRGLLNSINTDSRAEHCPKQQINANINKVKFF